VATALIQITQGSNTDIAGRAVQGDTTSGTVVFANGDNTGVVAWKYELVDVPPGSAIAVAVQGPGAVATYTMAQPDEPGSYRVMLTTYDAAGNQDVDIRNLIVPTPILGLLIGPTQFLPAQLPYTGPGAKPDELNVAGQSRGWAMNLTQKGMHYALLSLDTARETLAQTLVHGNVTGGTDIQVGTSGAQSDAIVVGFTSEIDVTDGARLRLRSSAHAEIGDSAYIAFNGGPSGWSPGYGAINTPGGVAAGFPTPTGVRMEGGWTVNPGNGADNLGGYFDAGYSNPGVGGDAKFGSGRADFTAAGGATSGGATNVLSGATPTVAGGWTFNSGSFTPGGSGGSHTGVSWVVTPASSTVAGTWTVTGGISSSHLPSQAAVFKLGGVNSNDTVVDSYCQAGGGITSRGADWLFYGSQYGSTSAVLVAAVRGGRSSPADEPYFEVASRFLQIGAFAGGIPTPQASEMRIYVNTVNGLSELWVAAKASAGVSQLTQLTPLGFPAEATAGTGSGSYTVDWVTSGLDVDNNVLNMTGDVTITMGVAPRRAKFLTLRLTNNQGSSKAASFVSQTHILTQTVPANSQFVVTLYWNGTTYYQTNTPPTLPFP
jgi:hypothetical protein